MSHFLLRLYKAPVSNIHTPTLVITGIDLQHSGISQLFLKDVREIIKTKLTSLIFRKILLKTARNQGT